MVSSNACPHRTLLQLSRGGKRVLGAREGAGLGRGRSLEVTLTVDSTCLFLASGLGAEGHSADGVRRVGGRRLSFWLLKVTPTREL